MSVQYGSARMITISGSQLLFDHIETSGEMWTGRGDRRTETLIRFEADFDQPPQVLVSMGMIDADHSTNLRLQLTAEQIRRGSFKAVACTWSDTRIGRLSISWIAMGKTGGHSEWDV